MLMFYKNNWTYMWCIASLHLSDKIGFWTKMESKQVSWTESKEKVTCNNYLVILSKESLNKEKWSFPQDQSGREIGSLQ